MGRQRNTKLDALLTEFGFTHAQLADKVNQTAEDMFGKPTQCTDRHVRRWIAGEVQWPWTRYLCPFRKSSAAARRPWASSRASRHAFRLHHGGRYP